MRHIKTTSDLAPRPHWAEIYRQPLHAQRYYAECRCGWMSEWTDDHVQARDYLESHVWQVENLPYVIPENSYRRPVAPGVGPVTHSVEVDPQSFGTWLTCECGWRMLVQPRSPEQTDAAFGASRRIAQDHHEHGIA